MIMENRVAFGVVVVDSRLSTVSGRKRKLKILHWQATCPRGYDNRFTTKRKCSRRESDSSAYRRLLTKDRRQA